MESLGVPAGVQEKKLRAAAEAHRLKHLVKGGEFAGEQEGVSEGLGGEEQEQGLAQEHLEL